MSKKLIYLLFFLVFYQPIVYLFSQNVKSKSCEIIVYYLNDTGEKSVLFNAWKNNGNWPDTNKIHSIYLTYEISREKNIKKIIEPDFKKLNSFWNELFKTCNSYDKEEIIQKIIYLFQDSIKLGAHGPFGKKSWLQLLTVLQKLPNDTIVLGNYNIKIEFYSYSSLLAIVDSSAEAQNKAASQLQGQSSPSYLKKYKVEKDKPDSWENLFLALPKLNVTVKQKMPIKVENDSDLKFSLVIENKGNMNISYIEFYYQIDRENIKSLKPQNRYKNEKKNQLSFIIPNSLLRRNRGSFQITFKYSPNPLIYAPKPIIIKYEKQFSAWFKFKNKVEHLSLGIIILSVIIITILFSLIFKPVRKKIFYGISKQMNKKHKKTEQHIDLINQVLQEQEIYFMRFKNEQKNYFMQFKNKQKNYFKQFKNEFSFFHNLATLKPYNDLVNLFTKFIGSLKPINNEIPIEEIADILNKNEKFLDEFLKIEKKLHNTVENLVDKFSREDQNLHQIELELKKWIINEVFISILRGKIKNSDKSIVFLKIVDNIKNRINEGKVIQKEEGEENIKSVDKIYEDNDIKGSGVSYMDVIKRKTENLNQYQKNISSIYQTNIRYKILETFFQRLQNHDVIQSILKENEISDLFDLHNYSPNNGGIQKINTSLTKLIRTLQRLEPRVPDYVKIFEQQINSAYKFWDQKGQAIIPLENHKLLSQAEEILGTYTDRTNLLKNLEVDSFSSINQELFIKNIVIGYYRPLYQEVLRKKFILHLNVLLNSSSNDDLKSLTERRLLITALINILQAGAIRCGIEFHEINPGDLFNSYFHEGLTSSSYLDKQQKLKKDLLKFEYLWDSTRIMWVDTSGYTIFDTNGKIKKITKSNVLVYKKEFLS